MANSPIRFPLSQRLRAARQNVSAGSDDAATGTSADKAPELDGLIGAAIEARRIELVRCGEELNRILADRRTNAFIEEQLRRLQQQTCRIAIIGQVKAGKSSFINAFVGKPDLLPTDVNPWTTAVTHLHFAKRAAPLEVAAEFTFFGPDEWQQLVNGGGQIRELTRRLVPGFEVELLHAHVELMQQRSQQRLGSALNGLLGTKHSFPQLSREIVERYVCSGLVGTTDLSGQGKGIFSDVTKSADLYFDQGSFGCATTIIDTPGTNDPFLVRDEITRRALESADIYIVVLTARQPLSTADLALLRILRGLHKDRIIIFINRIDELGSPAEDTPLIVQHVRRGLQREYPGIEFPIVAGSAFWGNAAQRSGPLDSTHVLTPQLQAYSAHLAASGAPVAALDSRSSGREIRGSLLLCSGLPRLMNLVSDVMWRHGVAATREIAATFAKVSRLAEISARHEIDRLADPRPPADFATSQRGELAQIETALAAYQRLTATLNGLVMDVQAKTERVVEDGTERLSEALRATVRDFIQAECARLSDATTAGWHTRVWRCNTASLRQSLETVSINIYREMHQRLMGCEAAALPALKGLLQRAKPDWDLPDDELPTLHLGDSPALSALSHVGALDLEEPWWRAWWARGLTSSQRLQDLDRLIRLEFFPIVDELVHAARARLRAQQQSLLRRSTLIYLTLAQMLEDRARTTMARSQELIAQDDHIGSGTGEHQTRDVQLASLASLLTQAQRLGARLAELQ